MRPLDGNLIKNNDVRLRNGANRKLAVPRVSDLANHQHVERRIQPPRHLRRDHHTPARQTQHKVRLQPLLPQVIPQLATRILTRGKCHAPR